MGQGTLRKTTAHELLHSPFHHREHQIGTHLRLHVVDALPGSGLSLPEHLLELCLQAPEVLTGPLAQPLRLPRQGITQQDPCDTGIAGRKAECNSKYQLATGGRL